MLVDPNDVRDVVEILFSQNVLRHLLQQQSVYHSGQEGLTLGDRVEHRVPPHGRSPPQPPASEREASTTDLRARGQWPENSRSYERGSPKSVTPESRTSPQETSSGKAMGENRTQIEIHRSTLCKTYYINIYMLYKLQKYRFYIFQCEVCVHLAVSL